MDKFDLEQARMVFILFISPILAFYTPVGGLMQALVVMFAFNIFAGMRADGVSIVRCKNFTFSKFKNALAELLLYFAIMIAIFTAMTKAGDSGAAILTAKSLTYVFMYVYMQNAFKNLIKAYPKNKALRIVYYLIRLEFKRALPSYIQPFIDRYDEEIKKAEAKKKI